MRKMIFRFSKKTIGWYFMWHGIWCLLITKKLLFWIFWRWKIWYFFELKRLMEIWCLLITEKFLLWTFRECKTRSFSEPKSWWNDDIYWLLKSSCSERFGDGEIRSFFSQIFDGKLIFTWSFWAFHDIYLLGKYGFQYSEGLHWECE